MNCSISFWRETLLTPMKSSFSQKATHIVFLVLLLLLSARSTTFANSATWNASSTNWNTNGNWSPATGYPGTTVGDTATFNNLSSVTVPFITATPTFPLAAIIFTASETHALGITVNPSAFLTISGAGITNNSVNTQNFLNNGNAGGNGGIIFHGSATAGSKTRFTNIGGSGGAGAGIISFNNTSTAGSGGFINNGGRMVSGAVGGSISFQDSATAGSGFFTNSPGTLSGAFGGGTDFLETSGAGNGTFTNNGTSVMGAYGGSTRFFNSSTAETSIFTNNGATVATPNALSAGYTTFADASTAENGTFTNNGGSVSGAPGGRVDFYETSSAGNATLIANGGTGSGGTIQFRDDSTGGMASVDLRNNGSGTAGNLDISNRHAPGVTIGSLTGGGNVFLGSRDLTIGSNNHSTTFSGVLQDGGTGGGTGGSLIKIGTGALTLSNPNTYTGNTTISKGSLVVKNTTGSATGPGAVQVNRGTLRGVGKIDGAVTVGNGSTSGAIISGGNGAANPGNLTINNALTFQSKSTYKCLLKRSTSGTGQVTGVAGKVSALGVIINANVPFTFVDTGTGTLPVGTVLTVINNTSASPIAGRFSNLANALIFTSNGNNFKVNYNGGTGNDLTLKVVP
jgi:autotransporter-associated beta strand protein